MEGLHTHHFGGFENDGPPINWAVVARNFLAVLTPLEYGAITVHKIVSSRGMWLSKLRLKRS